MATGDFKSAKALLPALLAKLSRQSGTGRGLSLLWEDAAGAQFARGAAPVRIDGDALVLRARDGAWAKRVREHEAMIGQRLSELTGKQVTRVVLEPS